MSDTVAICALDPGTTSGVARGVFDARPESVWEGLENGTEDGTWESWEEEGDPAVQAWSVMSEFHDWSRKAAPYDGTTLLLVFEDFVVRLGAGASSKRELLDPVRVSSACEALCWTRGGLRWAHPVYQQPSRAMSFATDKRLRAHGLWTKGSTHQRDAIRHMALAYAISTKEVARTSN